MPSLDATISLSKFGWTGKSIPTNLEDIYNHLPTWRDLHILRLPEGNHGYRFPWLCFQEDAHTKFMPAIKIGNRIDSGSYGTICMAKRAIFRPQQSQSDISGNTLTHFVKEGSSEEVIAKILPIQLTEAERNTSIIVQQSLHEEEIQAIVYEAALHILVNHVFQRCGYPHAVPTLHEVTALSEFRNPASAVDISGVVMTMEFIEGWTLFDFFKQYFRVPHTKVETETLLVDILIQLAIYLDILQTHLRFNHRDLKINNVLFRKTRSVSEITHTSLAWPWNCKRNIVIIDFGFSCIACDEPSRRSLLQAGSWFTARHDCMKKGRDIALFLYSLQTYFPLEDRISHEFYELL
jgi:serine/threonine protein kinase